MPRRVRWFIEPLGSHTNKVLASILDEENTGLFKAEHGKYVRVWECTLAERNMLIRDEISLQMRFRVWRMKWSGTLARWKGHKPWNPAVLRLLASRG